jgi:DTW domain-containing protein YfiP
MPRRVVTEGTPRCPRCRFAPRWCICDGFHPLALPLEVDVLVHHRELWRPTSTGRLINRVVPASRGHVFRHDLPLHRGAIVRPDRELWILHPRGAPLPAAPDPGRVQVLLLDGSWREAARMLQGVEGWGRAVSLPMPGASRYLLRDQQAAGHHSTVEALLFLLGALGLASEQAALRLQFELHVYAGLRARGEKAAAERFLADSPVREAFPELLEKLHQSRPR